MGDFAIFAPCNTKIANDNILAVAISLTKQTPLGWLKNKETKKQWYA